MEWLKFAHVATMITAIAIVEGPLFFYGLAIRDRDAGGMRRLLRWGGKSEAVGNLLAIFGVAFGLAAGLTGGINLLASWLVATYLIFGAAIGFGIVAERRLQPLRAALEASPDEEASPELMVLATTPLVRSMYIAPPLIMATILLLMVTKPNLW